MALLAFQRWEGIDPIAIRRAPDAGGAPRTSPLSPLPLSLPIDAPPSDGFGPRGSQFHTGIDFPAPLSAVVAARDGIVTAVGPFPGYGTVVELEHEQGVSTLYAHLSRALVEPGRRVTRGTPVGLVGATGDATGPHLHFEVRVRGAPVDPAPALAIDS